RDVRRYLRQFLMDARVIDAPYPLRKMIVELFILPFRPNNSAHAYQQIWWDEGSPLIVISRQLQKLLQHKLDLPIELAMRYGNPSIEYGIRKLLDNSQKIDEIFVVPLYPHYAMATYETVVVEVKQVLKKLKTNVKLTIQPPFYDDPQYISAMVESSKAYLQDGFDHLLFSYHGIPERHCKKVDPTGKHCLQVENCCEVPSPAHNTCYRHQVFRTTEEFVKLAEVPKDKYSVAFQSRLGVDSWLKPFTAEVIERLAQSGVKKLLVMCPAFVSDCLETLEEIGLRGKEAFLQNGGKEFQLIPCLNDHPLWIDHLAQMCNYEHERV
ncbi:MAG: ferrochelatase, partial [candidate division Zixibacteria bacterium]|nr:ferrochelatase [candidate division Zixibacteria bacterium]NIT73079.1 ferrochelatase [candidate division KSB1 bacterium]NIW49929.1 ferrochelatase [Gammaproteobacteria bacterium]NIS48044.1 ferrochelatase [candidate division Zixibacteria bacterium]NIU16905.1 ferrochelatase [candidate division Zixibacteria bacterium]